MNFPISLTLGSEIRKAGYTAYNLCRQLQYIRDKTVPLGLLAGAKGLAFITVLKGGFMLAPHFGTGLVVARLPSGDWSAPSAIGTIGVSYGPLIGAEIIDFVIILSSDEAVNAFAGGGQVSLGASVDIAVGPLGR
jgi:lipid-binding SYLF domain-containing protein